MGLKGEIDRNAKTLGTWISERDKAIEEARKSEATDESTEYSEQVIIETNLQSLVSKDFVLGLLSRLQQQIQDQAITGENIRFAIDSLDKVCDWDKKHNIQDMKFISIPTLLAVLDGAEPHKAEGETK